MSLMETLEKTKAWKHNESLNKMEQSVPEWTK